MIVLIGVAAIVYAWQLAARPTVRAWVPWLIPVAVAVIGCILWRREGGENRGPVVIEIIVIEILTLVSLAGGFAYRWHRAGD
jgi:hypothetical protein